MSETYSVRLEEDSLAFSAAHFITFAAEQCEHLHGHNYRVAVEVHGGPDEHGLVVDFLVLRDTLTAILGGLDHRVLLPERHRRIDVSTDGDEVVVRFADRRWVFPRDDCLILPLSNTTAEMLARYIGRRLLEDLPATAGGSPALVQVEVDEGFGRRGVCRLRPGHPSRGRQK